MGAYAESALIASRHPTLAQNVVNRQTSRAVQQGHESQKAPIEMIFATDLVQNRTRNHRVLRANSATAVSGARTPAS